MYTLILFNFINYLFKQYNVSFIKHYIVMRVILDNREHSLYEKFQDMLCKQTVSHNLTLIKDTLTIGDILFQTDDFQDILLIERKSFSDLLSSIKDGRYEEQSHRLLNTSKLPPHSIFYLLEYSFIYSKSRGCIKYLSS